MKRIIHSENRLWDAFNNGYVARRSRALAPTDCSHLFENVPVLECTPHQRGRYSEYFSPDDVDRIRDLDLDFVLRFAFGIIRGDILQAARYGVWSFHHGDEQRYRGSPPAFWEVAHNAPVTGVLLQRLTDRLDGGIVLRKGWFPTANHSYVTNTDRVHFGGVDFPAQVCRDVLRGDAAYLTAEPSTTEAAVFLKPDDRTAAAVGVKTAGAFVRHQVTNLALCDQWNVGMVREPIARFLEQDFVPEIEWFTGELGRDHYLADPFPVRSSDPAPIVLAEDYDYAQRVGSIVRVGFGEATMHAVDIAAGSHASYPYTFIAGDTEYVCAQIAGQRDVQLCRLTSDGVHSAGWLGIDEEVLDPTVIEHGGRWWIFFTRPGAHSLVELHIWSATELFGTWVPHPRNPVKTDVRSARPAGTPFVHEGALYRPAQDCSRSYGGALCITRVHTLTTEAFAEAVVRVIEPDPSWPYPDGIHTLSAAGDVTYLDAKRRVANLHETKAELAARLRRLGRKRAT